jgi:hypothetical protein
MIDDKENSGMLKWTAIVTSFAFLLVCLAGCGEPGTGKQGEKEIKVTPPATVNVKQGATESFKVSVSRTKFEGDVTVSFELPPDSGLSIEGGKDQKVEKGVKEKEFKLTAKDDAKPESFVVKLNGKGDGVSTTKPGEMTVKVSKKD